MVFHKLRTSNGFVTAELVVSVVERSKHFEETKASLFCRLGSSDNVRVPCWIEAVLDFFDLESTVTIGIKFVESFVDKALSKGTKFSAEGSQKFIETDLTIPT